MALCVSKYGLQPTQEEAVSVSSIHVRSVPVGEDYFDLLRFIRNCKTYYLDDTEDFAWSRFSILRNAVRKLTDVLPKSQAKEMVKSSLQAGLHRSCTSHAKKTDRMDYKQQAHLLKSLKEKHESQKHCLVLPTVDGYKTHKKKKMLKPSRKLSKAFYEAIRLIRNRDDWLEFVRCGLDLNDEDFEDIIHDLHTTENKMKTLQIWRRKEKSRTGVDPTAEHFIDLVDGFLQRRPEICLKHETSSKPGDLVRLFRKTCTPSYPTFNKACYFVIRALPDGSWMEFVYVGLDMSDDDIGSIKFFLCHIDKEKKYQMLMIWKNKQPEMPTASDLLKHVEEFLATKPAESASVNYNIGVVKAEKFVGSIGTNIELKSDAGTSSTSTCRSRKRCSIPHWSEVITSTEAKTAKMGV